MSRKFTATTDTIVADNLDDILTENGALSIGCWIKPYSLGGGSLSAIVSRENPGAVRFKTDGLAGAGNSFGFLIVGTTTLNRTAAAGTLSIGVNQYVLVTHDGSTTAVNCKLYHNGFEVAYDATFVTNGVTPTNNAGASTRIGSNNGTIRTFDGNISHIQIWNRVISPQEVRQSMYAPGSVRNGLRRYWPLYGTSGPEPDMAGLIGPLSNGVVTGAVLASGPPIGKLSRLNRRGGSIYKQPPSIGAVAYTKNLSDSFTFSDSISKDTLKHLIESWTLSHPVFSPSKDVLKHFTEAWTLSNSLSLIVLKAISDSLVLTETQNKNILRSISDSCVLSDTISKNFLKSITQSILVTEAAQKDVIKAFSDNFSISESLAKDILKSISDNLTLTESQAVSLIVALAALINFLPKGNIETHDKIAMLRDLIMTALSKSDIDFMENELVSTGMIKADSQDSKLDTDKLLYDWHGNE